MLDPKRPFLISPPFGSYFTSRRAYSVAGSYTRFPRPGRTMQVLRTVRPQGYTETGERNGWSNRVGLRNGGWQSLNVGPTYEPHQIVSFALIDGDEAEWDALVVYLARNVYLRTIEVNVSCPNTDHPTPSLPPENFFRALAHHAPHVEVIWKLPPIEQAVIEATNYLADHGARYLHLSNTLPSPNGGLSGRAQREVNLGIVERRANWLAQRYQVTQGPELIAGGGIYEPDHMRQYKDAGAMRFSLATAFFWPPRAYRVMRSLR